MCKNDYECCIDNCQEGEGDCDNDSQCAGKVFFKNECIGLSKMKGAKFRELSSNFPKLADWLCMGWPFVPGSPWSGIFKQGDIYFAQACTDMTSKTKNRLCDHHISI